MHKKLWCSSVFTVFWVLITLWWPLGSSAPLVRYLPSRSNLVITPWCTPLQPPILQYHNIILFCCLSVRPRQRLTNNWTKFWQFICSYLFLCQCCCQLFYFWSASVNSSFMAQQPAASSLLYFACMGRIELSGLAKMFLSSQPPQRPSLIPSLLSLPPVNKLEGHPFGCFVLDLGWKLLLCIIFFVSNLNNFLCPQSCLCRPQLKLCKLFSDGPLSTNNSEWVRLMWCWYNHCFM